MLRNKIFVVIAVFFAFLQTVNAEQFAYLFDSRYVVKVSTLTVEDVLVNGDYSHTSRLLNTSMSMISKIENGRAFFESTYRLAQDTSTLGTSYSLIKDYQSTYWKDSTGKLDIKSDYFMPVLRNIPIVPAASVEGGSSWYGNGFEVHDFRDSMGITRPYKFPVNVVYKYLGKKDLDGVSYPLISAKCAILHIPDSADANFEVYPVKISGYAEYQIYWDSVNGMWKKMTETFDILFELNDGQTVEYKGTSTSAVTELLKLNSEEEVAWARDQINGMTDVDVECRGNNPVFTIRNVGFNPDSPELTIEEKEKIDRVSDIMMKYKDRSFLIVGHTAMAGTPSGRQKLSEERANAVRNYLLSKGFLNPDQLLTQGKGATIPVADNNTEEGRKKNRRVEIIVFNY